MLSKIIKHDVEEPNTSSQALKSQTEKMQENIGTELINRAIDGDEKAFEELYMNTYRFVYAVAKHYLNNDEDIYDALQDTYTRVYKGIKGLKDPSAFAYWLRKIAENCSKTIYVKWSEVNNSKDIDTTQEHHDDSAPSNDVSLDVSEVLNQLDPEQYELLAYIYYDKLSIGEIAKLKGMPKSTVQSRIKVAKNNLKELLRIKGIDKAIYSGDFISIITTSFRHIIGTDILSATVAQEILSNVKNNKTRSGAIIFETSRKQRNAAILKLSTILLFVMIFFAIITTIVVLLISPDSTKNINSQENRNNLHSKINDLFSSEKTPGSSSILSSDNTSSFLSSDTSSFLSTTSSNTTITSSDTPSSSTSSNASSSSVSSVSSTQSNSSNTESSIESSDIPSGDVTVKKLSLLSEDAVNWNIQKNYSNFSNKYISSFDNNIFMAFMGKYCSIPKIMLYSEQTGMRVLKSNGDSGIYFNSAPSIKQNFFINGIYKEYTIPGVYYVEISDYNETAGFISCTSYPALGYIYNRNNAYDLKVKGNYAYFLVTSGNTTSLCRVKNNISSETPETIISNRNSGQMVLTDNYLVYINSNNSDTNHIYAYDIAAKKEYLVKRSASSNFFAVYGDLLFTGNSVINIKNQKTISILTDNVTFTKAFCHGSNVLLYNSSSTTATIYNMKSNKFEGTSSITADKIDFCCSSQDGYIYYLDNDSHRLIKLNLDGTEINRIIIEKTPYDL